MTPSQFRTSNDHDSIISDLHLESKENSRQTYRKLQTMELLTMLHLTANSALKIGREVHQIEKIALQSLAQQLALNSDRTTNHIHFASLITIVEMWKNSIRILQCNIENHLKTLNESSRASHVSSLTSSVFGFLETDHRMSSSLPFSATASTRQATHLDLRGNLEGGSRFRGFAEKILEDDMRQLSPENHHNALEKSHVKQIGETMKIYASLHGQLQQTAETVQQIVLTLQQLTKAAQQSLWNHLATQDVSSLSMQINVTGTISMVRLWKNHTDLIRGNVEHYLNNLLKNQVVDTISTCPPPVVDPWDIQSKAHSSPLQPSAGSATARHTSPPMSETSADQPMVPIQPPRSSFWSRRELCELIEAGKFDEVKEIIGELPLHKKRQLLNEKIMRREHSLMHTALEQGATHLIRFFLEQNPKLINETNSSGSTLLYQAVFGGDRDLVATLLEYDEIDINKVNKNGISPLCKAVLTVFSGQAAIIRLLLNSGADINQCSRSPMKRGPLSPLYGCPVIFYAINKPYSSEVADLLLTHPGIDLHSSHVVNGKGRFTPLEFAVWKKKFLWIDKLREKLESQQHHHNKKPDQWKNLMMLSECCATFNP